jgi:hypothetical protein
MEPTFAGKETNHKLRQDMFTIKDFFADTFMTIEFSKKINNL